jgi:hypothetical protein
LWLQFLAIVQVQLVMVQLAIVIPSLVRCTLPPSVEMSIISDFLALIDVIMLKPFLLWRECRESSCRASSEDTRTALASPDSHQCFASIQPLDHDLVVSTTHYRVTDVVIACRGDERRKIVLHDYTL